MDLRERGAGVGIRLLQHLPFSRKTRVEHAWEHLTVPPKNWWNIPAVQRRWNKMITGTEEQTPVTWVAQRWLTKGEYRAISPGCGTGHRELRWAATGKFRHIEAFDLSPNRIRFAQEQARKEGLSHIITFSVADVNGVDFPPDTFDVIIVEDALHHFRPVEAVVHQFYTWLKPGGLFIMNEFVGPRRFQWSREQLTIATAALRLLPPEYRRLYRTGRIKRRVYRPGLIRMWLQDPSEAVESDRILPTVQHYFQVEALRGYGGSLLAIVLNGIAHHFVHDDPETRRWLALLFGIEDYFLNRGVLSHDYVFLVARKSA